MDEYSTGLDDKRRLGQWLVPGIVADIGAGDGLLSAYFATLDGIEEVHAIDHSVAAVSILTEHCALEVHHGSTERLADYAEELTNVVFSSVLHQIHAEHGRAGFHAAIDQATGALLPGGRLIIRDGVMPSSPLGRAQLTVPSEEASQLVNRYNRRVASEALRLEPVTGNRLAWQGTRHAVSEAMLAASWPPAVGDHQAIPYQLGTGDKGYPALILKDAQGRERSLRAVHHETYTQPGYHEHLTGFAASDLPEQRVWFPDTNAIWVFEKA